MKSRLRLTQAPERRLAMTFSLRQALEILQMPQQELAQWIAQEIEKNPLLEVIPSSQKPPPLVDIPSTPSLYEHLLQQIRDSFPHPTQRRLAEGFAQHLDEKGFLSTSLEDLSTLFQKSKPELETLLATLQTFDPPGIFARSLQEALLLQLKAQGDSHSAPFHLIQHCFEDLMRGRYMAIKKKMGAIDLATAIQKLARLRFRPAEAFQREPTPLATVDLFIVQTEKGWTVATCEDEIPKFQFSPAYASLIPQSPEEKVSVLTWSTAAKWLMRSLKRRRQILLQIGTWLARKQTPYLAQTGPLRPLTAKDLSQELHLSESTLSRALSGKYVATPRGLLPIKSLLLPAPSTVDARMALSQLVAQENKKTPLTDDQLSIALHAQGYKIARRTITKYRKELHIASTAARKHLRETAPQNIGH